jgi:hypothetical protein
MSWENIPPIWSVLPIPGRRGRCALFSATSTDPVDVSGAAAIDHEAEMKILLRKQ